MSRTTSPEPGRSIAAGIPPGTTPPVNVQERRNFKEKLLRNKETRFLTHSGNDPREVRPNGSVSAAVDRARSPLGSHQVDDHLDLPVRPGSSAQSYMLRNGGAAPSIAESERGTGGFFKRPSFAKAFSIRRKNPSSSKKSNLGGTMDSSTSLPNHDNGPPAVPYSERDYYFNFLSPSGTSGKAQAPADRPAAAAPGARNQPPVFSPFAADAVRTARREDSPWSSTLSHGSVTSPEPSTTRSTTPGTRSESPPPRKGEMSHDPTYPLAWPPKAAHLLGADGPAADGPTVKTGPAAPKPQWPPVETKAKKTKKKKQGFVFSPEMEMAFPSAPKKAEPPVLLDIGPTRRPNPLRAGTDLLKKPFESEKPLLQLFYGDTHKHAPSPY